MRAFPCEFVDQLNGHWSASFRGTRQSGYSGNNSSGAIRRLIPASEANLDTEQIIDSENQTKPGHLEFLILFRTRCVIPVLSLN